MSAGEKAFGLIKTVFTAKDQIDALGREMTALGDRLSRLADSHVAMRERVSDIEGYLRAATGAPFGGSGRPRIEG